MNTHAHNVVTFPSHTTMLTGLNPYQHGIRDNAGFKLEEQHRTLAQRLGEKGYDTGAFVSAFPLDRRFGLDRGFDVYDDKYKEGKMVSAFVVAERSADETLSAAASWWKNRGDKPKFMWVHLYEPHAPYEPPSPYKERYSDPYLGEIATADAALERHIKPLIDNGEVFVILTSDHGEARGEHGELTHGLFAYEETLRVPMVIMEKDVLEPERVDEYVRHIDIVPTLIDRLDLPAEPELPGKSLLQVDGDRDSYFESLTANVNMGWAPLVGMIHERHKYIDLPIAELYDLEADPDEEKNILDSSRRMTFAIRKMMREAAPGAAEAERNISSEEAKELLALGYITGTSDKTEFTEADDPKNLSRFFSMIHRIINHFHAGESDQAISLAEQLLEERPDMETARELLAFVLQTSDRPEAAVELLRKSVRDGTASDPVRKRLGLILAETGNAREAVEVLESFAGSDDPELLNAYGIALADTGKAAEAVGIFNRVLEIDSSNATAYQNLAIVALRTGNVDRAQSYLEKALALNDEMPLALNTWGVIMMRRNRPADAIRAWQKAVSIDPTQYDALLNMATVARREGREDVYLNALQRFIDTAPAERFGKEIEQARRALAGRRAGGSSG